MARADLRQIIPTLGVSRRHNAYLTIEAIAALRAGGDIHALSLAIQRISDVANANAERIARLIHASICSAIERDRQKKLGVKFAIWCHSGSPCLVAIEDGATELEVELARAHLSANGKVYEVTAGMLLHKSRTWPGRDPGCKCYSKSIVPGLKPIPLSH